MSRSVDYVSEAAVVIYLDCTDIEDDWEWECLLDGLRRIIEKRYPSFVSVDKWPGRELHTILENAHTSITIAEYCGLVSVSLSSNQESNLSDGWTNSIAGNFTTLMKKNYGDAILRKIGSFSNGECVYEGVK